MWTVAVAGLAAASLGAASPPQAEAGVYVSRDIPYVLRGRTHVRLDVWRRTGDRGHRPVVVLVHGGGWWLSDKREWEVIDWPGRLVRRGFVVVSINYRLACGTTFIESRSQRIASALTDRRLCGHRITAQREDVMAALEWTRAQIYRRGGDPHRMALVGASAGGHLAAITGSDRERTVRLKAVASLSAPLSLPWIGRSGPVLRPAATRAMGCRFSACPDRWRLESPSTWVKRFWTPPTYVMAATGDRVTPSPQATQYNRSLRGHRVRSRFAIVNAACHGPDSCGDEYVNGTRRLLFDDLATWLSATV